MWDEVPAAATQFAGSGDSNDLHQRYSSQMRPERAGDCKRIRSPRTHFCTSGSCKTDLRLWRTGKLASSNSMRRAHHNRGHRKSSDRAARRKLGRRLGQGGTKEGVEEDPWEAGETIST